MKEWLRTFVNIFKQVNDNHVSIYNGEKSKQVVWSSIDFDTDPVLAEMEQTNKLLMTGILKKGYDLVRSYERAYKMTQMTREDYFRQAVVERQKDLLIVDAIATNLGNSYEDMKNMEEA